jgi:hypothetical protein
MASNVAISYFIDILFMAGYFGNFQPLLLENYRTNEKLMITRETYYLNISRYPIGSSTERIKEMREIPDWKSRKIKINI